MLASGGVTVWVSSWERGVCVDGTVYLLGVAGLTASALTAWVFSDRRGSQGPFSYGLLAYARGGRYAVTQSALAVLHAHGFVDAWRAGMVIMTEESAKAGMSDNEVERALRAALVAGPAGPRLLGARPQMLRALDAVQSEGVAAGLLRSRRVVRLQRTAACVVATWTAAAALFVEPPLTMTETLTGMAVGLTLLVLPRRTRAGREALVAARAKCPLPTPLAPKSQPTPPPAEVGVAVAIYGSAALLAIMPRLAREGGVLDRAAPTDTAGVALDQRWNFRNF